MNDKKLCLDCKFNDENKSWSLRNSIISSSVLKRDSNNKSNAAYYDLFSLSELSIFLKNTPLNVSEGSVYKFNNYWARFGEKYSGSKIDQIIFKPQSSQNTDWDANYEFENAIIGSLTSLKVDDQIGNRWKGFSYLKKLWHSLKDWGLNFSNKSKWNGMTPQEIEFIEDIHNLQNYKPISINFIHTEETRKFSIVDDDNWITKL